MDVIESSRPILNRSMNPTRFHNVLAALVLLITSGCPSPDPNSATTGSITVAIDESIAPPIDSLLNQFHDLYPNSSVTKIITSAREAVMLLGEKKVHTAFIGRDLLKDESDAFLSAAPPSIISYKLGIHALGLIVHSRNPVRSISLDQLSKILQGTYRQWNALGGKNTPLLVALDGTNSTAYHILKQQHIFDSLNCQYKILNRSIAVDSFVRMNTNAIGIVPLSYVSRDTNTVRPLDIVTSIPEDTTGKMYPIALHVANIYRERYPLRSNVIAVRYDEGLNLSAGIVTFFASAIGQKILLNNGLVPATIPVRLVEFGERSGE